MQIEREKQLSNKKDLISRISDLYDVPVLIIFFTIGYIFKILKKIIKK